MEGLTVGFWISIAIQAFVLILFVLGRLFKKRLVSSEHRWKHSFGMVLTWGIIVSWFGILAIYALLKFFAPRSYLLFLFPLLVLVFLIYFLSKSMSVFKFEKRYQKDSYSHMLHLLILLSIGLFMIYVIVTFNINQSNFLPFGLCATVLGLIFQDAIKGVVAYYHLRANGLLHIGDWIEVPAQQIDGVITDISLITVTVKNWDNTTSNIAITSLQRGSFKNNQEVWDGKTSGRRMYCSFLIDSRSVYPMTEKQIEELKEKLKALGEEVIMFETEDTHSQKVLNLYLFRMYLRHWLMKNKEVSRYPRLLVRLLEPTAEGIPLQVWAYLLATSLAPFELSQSRIMEHVLLSMEWFGLRLYQKPSGEDINRITVESYNSLYDEKAD